jgi:UDP-N-acetylmuramyl tripeptide synthase
MLDYAHNAHGMNAIGKFVKKVEATKEVGVIAGAGDRRDEDTIALGEQAAMVFDESHHPSGQKTCAGVRRRISSRSSPKG